MGWVGGGGWWSGEHISLAGRVGKGGLGVELVASSKAGDSREQGQEAVRQPVVLKAAMPTKPEKSRPPEKDPDNASELRASPTAGDSKQVEQVKVKKPPPQSEQVIGRKPPPQRKEKIQAKAGPKTPAKRRAPSDAGGQTNINEARVLTIGWNHMPDCAWDKDIPGYKRRVRDAIGQEYGCAPDIVVLCHGLRDEADRPNRWHCGEFSFHLQNFVEHKNFRVILKSFKTDIRDQERAICRDPSDVSKSRVTVLCVCKSGRHRSVGMARILVTIMRMLGVRTQEPQHMCSWDGLCSQCTDCATGASMTQHKKDVLERALKVYGEL